MRRCLKGIRHQQSTPFTSFNDGPPIRVDGATSVSAEQAARFDTKVVKAAPPPLKALPRRGLESRRGVATISYAGMPHVSLP